LSALAVRELNVDKAAGLSVFNRAACSEIFTMDTGVNPVEDKVYHFEGSPVRGVQPTEILSEQDIRSVNQIHLSSGQ
jgi:hypothetical protein